VAGGILKTGDLGVLSEQVRDGVDDERDEGEVARHAGLRHVAVADGQGGRICRLAQAAEHGGRAWRPSMAGEHDGRAWRASMTGEHDGRA